MLHTFLMLGQSNMSGRGSIQEADLICDKRIKMLRNGIWMPMTEPIQPDFPWAGVGPAASFAEAWLRDNPNEEIGLIPCSHGATTIEQWLPGSPLFENAVMQTRLARRSGVLDGFLWHQGESDCISAQIPHYCQQLQQVINAFRRALDAPDIPFLIGGLGDFLEYSTYLECSKQYKVMNDLLKWIVLMEHDCYFVTAERLQSNEDCLHFNAASQRIFGRRYYEAYRTQGSIYEPLAYEAAADKPAADKPAAGISGEVRLKYIAEQLFGAKL